MQPASNENIAMRIGGGGSGRGAYDGDHLSTVFGRGNGKRNISNMGAFDSAVDSSEPVCSNSQHHFHHNPNKRRSGEGMRLQIISNRFVSSKRKSIDILVIRCRNIPF